jgi:hypothetical protein
MIPLGLDPRTFCVLGRRSTSKQQKYTHDDFYIFLDEYLLDHKYQEGLTNRNREGRVKQLRKYLVIFNINWRIKMGNIILVMMNRMIFLLLIL